MLSPWKPFFPIWIKAPLSFHANLFIGITKASHYKRNYWLSWMSRKNRWFLLSCSTSRIKSQNYFLWFTLVHTRKEKESMEKFLSWLCQNLKTISEKLKAIICKICSRFSCLHPCGTFQLCKIGLTSGCALRTMVGVLEEAPGRYPIIQTALLCLSLPTWS